MNNVSLLINQTVVQLLVLLFSISIHSQNKWDTEAKRAHEINRRDSTTWNRKLFKMDVDFFGPKKHKGGTFPVPNYNLIGKNSFVGLGYDGNFKGMNLNGKHFLYQCFFAKKNDFNKQYIPDVDQDVFFVIAISMDIKKPKELVDFGQTIYSRNHPNYLAQGYYKTKNNIINYNAFITGDRDAYAIVNERIFDLEIGKMIFIVPQKDASLRSMQIDIPRLSIDETKKYVEKLLKTDKEIIDLYTNKGSI